MLVDKCDGVKQQVAGGEIFRRNIVQQLANATEDISSSIDCFIRHFALAQKNVGIAFCIWVATFSKRFRRILGSN